MSSFDFDDFLPSSWLEDGLSLRQVCTTISKVSKNLRKGVSRTATIAIATSVFAVNVAVALNTVVQSPQQMRLFDEHPAAAVMYSGEQPVPKEYWTRLMDRIAAMPKLSEANDDADIPPFL